MGNTKVADDVRGMLLLKGCRDRPDLPRIHIPAREGTMLSRILHPAAPPLTEEEEYYKVKRCGSTSS